jgi:ketopantoate reductase
MLTRIGILGMGGVGGYFGGLWRKPTRSDQIEIVLSLAVKPKKQLQLQD